MSTKDYAEYFLNSSSTIVQLELLEVSHPDFTQTYRVVRNALAGVTVTIETGASYFFTYYPLRITAKTSRDTLDYVIGIELGDLGEIIPTEIDSVRLGDGFGTKPTVIYRTYRSDILTEPLHGPIELEVTSFSFRREGATFEAKAPSLAVSKTGEIYDLYRFPMLRGFL
jgi:hypothetical protein